MLNNIGDKSAIFEATHGTAPKYAGLDKVNPGSLLLSGVMLLSISRMEKAMGRTIRTKTVTYDFARLMKGANGVKCSEFATAVINNIK